MPTTSTTPDIAATKASVASLTPEEQTGARALAQNYMSQGKNALEATNLALQSYAKTQNNPSNSSVSNPSATTIPQTTQTPQISQINGGISTTSPSQIPSQVAETTAPTITPPKVIPSTATPTPVTATPVTNAISAYPSPPPAVTTPKATVPPTTWATTEKIIDPEIRREQIRTNLQEWMKNAPQLFKDRTTFDAAYWYSGADTDKKAIMDALWNARTPTSEDDIYNSLKTWVKLDINTPEGVRANTRYNLFSKFNWMWSEQLLTELRNNNIPTNIQNELSTNANFVAAKQKRDNELATKAINDANNAIVNSATGKATEVKDYGQSLSDKIVSFLEKTGKTQNDLINYRDFMKTADPELTGKVEEMNAKNKLLKEKADARDAMYKTVVADHPWMSKGAAIALAARMNEPLNEEIKSLTYELENLSSDIKYRNDLLSEDYKYQVWKQERADKLASEVRGYGVQAITSEYNTQKQKELFELQQAYANPDINSTDPNIARIAAQKMIDAQLSFAQTNGIPVVRNSAQILSDAQAYAQKNGVSLANALQETFTKPFQGKSEYTQAIQNIQAKGEAGKYSMWFDPITGRPYSFNQRTGEITGYGGWATTTTWVKAGWFNTSSTWMRTDRHNNPTAMTTDVAKSLGLVEWVDYTKWDSFGWWKFFTARLIGDPIETTIKWLDNAAKSPNISAFYTQGWAQRWTHTAYTDEQWNAMSHEEKRNAVIDMYKNEWGNWSLAWVSTSSTQLPSKVVQAFKEFKDKVPSQKDLAERQIDMTVDEFENARASYKEEKQPLSKVAQEYWNSWTLPQSKTEADKVVAELAEAGYFDWMNWNKEYLSAKPADKQSMSALLQTKDKLLRLKQLHEKYKDTSGGSSQVWWLDNLWGNIADAFGASSQEHKDWLEMKNITTDELNKYIQKMTGAAVGVAEAKRLQAVRPTLNQSAAWFEENLNKSLQYLDDDINNILNTYWFDDEQKLADRVWYKTKITSKQQPSIITTSSGLQLRLNKK